MSENVIVEHAPATDEPEYTLHDMPPGAPFAVINEPSALYQKLHGHLYSRLSDGQWWQDENSGGPAFLKRLRIVPAKVVIE